MEARAEAVAVTRATIVEAAKELHSARGVLATSWDDIAKRAGVSTATVYRHFPTLAELIPACARSVFDLIQPPTVEEAASTFAALERVADRFEHLVRTSCHCFAAGEGWLHAAHRERDFIPELDAALTVIEDTLAVLIEAAAGRRPPKRVHGVLFVLCNFPFWKALIDQGLSRRAVEEAITRVVREALVREGLDRQEA